MGKDKKRILHRVFQVVLSSLIAIVIFGALIFVTHGRDIPVLNPQGLIANQERDLIVFTFALGLVVVIPVFIMLFGIAWKYRASNKKAIYQPEFDGHRGLEALWWGIPCLIILVLAIVTSISTHALDPFKPIQSNVEPVKIEVVALEWRWLFIYPDKGIATLNFANIPKNTPIDLTITSDAPMNSFWVPALAGQVYAMSGMSTQLHLMADTVGSYNGSSANISGKGFADMNFKINSMSESDFSAWAIKSANSSNMLSSDTYKTIAAQSTDKKELTYVLMNKDLYNEIIMKYMGSGSTDSTKTENSTNMQGTMPGMNM
jgi:cytochrome o ubiquinol oxidase subunit 2